MILNEVKYIPACKKGNTRIFLAQKNAISPFFDASGNKNIGAIIRIGQ